MKFWFFFIILLKNFINYYSKQDQQLEERIRKSKITNK